VSIQYSSTRVNQFKFRISFFGLSFNFLPVNLELFSLLYGGFVVNDNWVRKVSFSKDNLACLFIIIINSFIFLLGSLFVSFIVTLSSFSLLREGFVSSSSNLKFVSGNIYITRASTSISDFSSGDF